MPIVRVEMFPGRDGVQKEFLARSIADAVAEIAGTSREGVHVIFDDVPREEWAIGPRLAANREQEPEADREPAYVSVGRVQVKEGKHEEYLDWRRNSVFPFMASHEGFVSSTLLSVADEPNQYVIINKWTSPAAQDAYTAKPREAELRIEARELLDQLVTEDFDGRVVDVFNQRVIA
jgi:4-oxalocrotonate tautomerase family enzyme